MTSSPAWDDINPAPSRHPPNASDCRRTAFRVRNLTEFAVQMIGEGQLDRAERYLAEAADALRELRS